jgi:hypothetical protein
MMRRSCHYPIIGILALAFSQSLESHAAFDPQAELDRYNVVWDSPSENAWGSMPIGNGDLGANLWVEPAGDLVLLLSKSDSWDEVSRLVKLGRIRIKLPSVENFRQELRLVDGEVRITGGGATTRVWIDANRPVVHVEIDGDKPFATSVAHETWRTTARQLSGGEIRGSWGLNQVPADERPMVAADTVLEGRKDQLVFHHRNTASVWEAHMRMQKMDAFITPSADPLLHRTFGCLVRGKDLVSDGKSRLTARAPAKRFDIAITALTARTPTANDWVKQVTELALVADRVTLDNALAEHARWWRDFWDRSWIVVSGKTALPANDQPWQTGRDSQGGSRFGGTIAGARVIGRALSAAEIAGLAAEKPSTETQLAAEDITTACTLSAWIKPAAGESGRILDKHPLGISRGIVFDAYRGLALRLIVGGDTMIQTNCLKAGEWQHVAATVDAGSGVRRLYLNGKLVKEERAVSEAETVTRGYALQRWMNACAGRGGAPIKFNGSIFNVDCVHPIKSYCGVCTFDADFREWGDPYWWQNTRLPYWSMPAAGDFDLMRPMLKMYTDALPLRKAATRAYFKHDGAFFPEIMEHWGTSYGKRDTYEWDPANPQAPQLWWGSGRKTSLGAGNRADLTTPPGWYWQSGLEMVAIMLAYCQHSGDDAFRDQKLLPFAQEILTFYDAHWPRGDDGKLRFFPVSSLEAIQNAANPMPEVAGLRFLLPQLISITSDEEQRTAWRKMLADLPPVPVGGEPGQRRLLAAEEGKRHSAHENPELYAVFPYSLYGVGKQDLELALNAWPRRADKVNAGWSQNGIHAAMLGLAAEARQIVTANFSRHASGFRFPAMWGPNYDWIPDQDHGCVNMRALQAMLLQTDGSRILLLPAWPKEWDVNFKLHAPRQTTVACEVRSGKVIKLIVTPESRRKDVEVCAPFS